MTDTATVLERLIIAAEAVLTLRNPGDDDALVALAEEVARLVAMPADGPRVMHPYTALLMVALRHAATARRIGVHHSGIQRDSQIYFRIIGVMLPDVRADFSAAIELRKRPTP